MDDAIGRTGREAYGLTKRQCTGVSKTTGERCGRAPIPGGTVCRLHGGNAPQVLRAARDRLLALVDPAMDALLRALQTGPRCDACGRSDADRDPVTLKAAQLVLDRAGFHPTLAVQAVAPVEIPEWTSRLTDDELQQFGEMIARAKERMASGADPETRVPNVEVVEADEAKVNSRGGSNPRTRK